MSNENQGAQNAHIETFTSLELQTLIAETRTRRNEMSEQTELARVDLSEKRAAIRFLKPKSVEEATIAQARFTVLTDAGTALDQELESLEGALQTALAKEQRARDFADLTTFRADLEAEKEQLKTRSLEAAIALQIALDAISEGQARVTSLTHQIGWKMDALGPGVREAVYGFADGHLAAHLSESGQVETVVIQDFVSAAQRLRQSRHIDRNGITLWNDAPRNTVNGTGEGVNLSGILPATAQEAAAGLANALRVTE